MAARTYLHTFLLSLTVLCAAQCMHTQPDVTESFSSFNNNNGFVDKKYARQTPLASLTGMPIYSDREDSFVLKQDTRVQVYAVGELIYNLANAQQQYMFKDDNMELFFGNNHAGDTLAGKPQVYIFSWSDGYGKGGRAHVKKQDAELWGSMQIDSINSKYIAEIKLPWNLVVRDGPQLHKTIDFDIQIGDNDDFYKQEAIIAWNSTIDRLHTPVRTYGKLLLTRKLSGTTGRKDTMVSVYRTPVTDGDIEAGWYSIPAYNISYCVFGDIDDTFDLSASVRSCWDKKALYFLIEVQDSNRRQVWANKLFGMQTFLDCGWIENEQGKKIWEMHALHSTPAGGAFKNRKTDTVLTLKKGRYKLRYISDESHAPGKWDDDPPETPFYGIVVYGAR